MVNQVTIPQMSEELKDEVEALNSIYPDCMQQRSSLIYDLIVPDSKTKVQVSFSSSYPDERPNLLSIQQQHQPSNNELLQILQDILKNIFVPGQVCIFDFLEMSREIIESFEGPEESEENNVDDGAGEEHSNNEIEEDIFEGWIESEPLLDRKSLFIARAAEVHSTEVAMNKISKLKSDKKISKATHNITAWRIKLDNGVTFQDCDDDGETAAGGRLLHLLQLADCWNVVVCVSRWFGGVHLGPDRFKHINSTARDALVKGRFIMEEKQQTRGSNQKKKK